MTDYSSYTDTDLASLLKEGDHQAYTFIYDRYKFLLYAHAYKKLADREEARDVVQEVFVTLWNKRERIDAQSNLAGYLYTALRNAILNLFARKEVRTRYTDAMAAHYRDDYAPTDHGIRSQQLSELIDREIEALPSKMQEVFVLSRKAHLNRKEISLQLGISEATVDRQIANALKILRARLTLVAYLLVFFNI
ncbi:RNA polymerase subunit sigma-70 [Pedobacter sp. KBW06]|uniref:RNA polymerase sigma factor n=1 Tax=Pedobacter sp. KBW06 TaxID=2153359 RepID=UPI000F5A565E|nr:RNA polymerase sigma-70 factor [Pedobacter sp. KBW06]RQO74945.1 RNA polymerase subunit sigma-70 [Pedobacter sp. KBW06]